MTESKEKRPFLVVNHLICFSERHVSGRFRALPTSICYTGSSLFQLCMLSSVGEKYRYSLWGIKNSLYFFLYFSIRCMILRLSVSDLLLFRFNLTDDLRNVAEYMLCFNFIHQNFIIGSK